MTGDRLRVVALENGKVTREGIKVALEGADIDVWVTGEEVEFFNLVETQNPHVGLVDLKMDRNDADYSGLEHIRIAKARWPHIKFVAFTAFPLLLNFKKAIDNAADGFVVKDADTDLPRIVRTVAAGHPEFDHALLRELSENFGSPQAGPPVDGCPLSARELDVLREATAGKSNKEIGSALRISDTTVKTHFASIFEKLGVNDRRDAVLQGRVKGFLN